MCAALGSSFVTLADFTRMTTFRWTLIVASAFFLCTVLLFGFVYWRTAVYLTNDNDALLSAELHVFVANTPEQRLQEINDRLSKDPQQIKIAGLFGPDGRRIAGNIEGLPVDFRLTFPPMQWSFASITMVATFKRCASLRIRYLTAKPW